MGGIEKGRSPVAALSGVYLRATSRPVLTARSLHASSHEKLMLKETSGWLRSLTVASQRDKRAQGKAECARNS